MKRHLLIVEDDAALNELLQLHFEELGYSVAGALSVAQALKSVARRMPDVALVDQRLPDGDGLDLLHSLLDKEPELPAIMITGMHDLELAIQAIQQGAYDFIHKPLKIEELQCVVERALEHRRLVRRVDALQEPPVTVGQMLGQSRAMLAVTKEIALVAKSEARVLITGESGTGKELVARAIHSHSGREGPFLAVNCAAIVDNLLESELFGHEKGAFTGANARKVGKFELASDGTLFLDEVGELALPLQAKLLRVLQEGVFERVGGVQQISTTARVIAATNRDLAAEVKAGRFREDLLYRLDVLNIHMPPLRERREDIPLLVQGLIKRLAHHLHKPMLSPTREALARLQAYDWPGNVRELENVLTQALVRARDTVLTPDSLSLGGERSCEPAQQDSPFRAADGHLLTLDEMEAQHVARALTETGWHKGRSCELLGISRPALERKIRKYRLHPPEARAA